MTALTKMKTGFKAKPADHTDLNDASNFEVQVVYSVGGADRGDIPFMEEYYEGKPATDTAHPSMQSVEKEMREQFKMSPIDVMQSIHINTQPANTGRALFAKVWKDSHKGLVRWDAGSIG